MKTGNTRMDHRPGRPPRAASMEPGHEDREYRYPSSTGESYPYASMEPGHEDREYGRIRATCFATAGSLNGARS